MASTILEATVSKINGTGFQVREQDGWINVSKYAKSVDVVMPPVGAKVKVTLDGSNFARKIEVLEAAHAEPERPPSVELTQHALSIDSKDLRITRLACLNTATAIIAGTAGRADPDEVIALAERLESWVLR